MKTATNDHRPQTVKKPNRVLLHRLHQAAPNEVRSLNETTKPARALEPKCQKVQMPFVPSSFLLLVGNSQSMRHFEDCLRRLDFHLKMSLRKSLASTAACSFCRFSASIVRSASMVWAASAGFQVGLSFTLEKKTRIHQKAKKTMEVTPDMLLLQLGGLVVSLQVAEAL